MAAFTPTFTTAQLFGGAITASIPSSFIDASNLRQVPDNQEVFVDGDGLASVTFDILEKLETSDVEKAIAIHLSEVVEGDAAEVVEAGGLHDTLGSMSDIPVHSVLAIVKPAGSNVHESRRVDFTAIIMMLVRLDKVGTDFLVFINVPHVAGEYPVEEVDLAAKKWGPLVSSAGLVKKEIQKSLKIVNWGLFDEEQDETMGE